MARSSRPATRDGDATTKTDRWGRKLSFADITFDDCVTQTVRTSLETDSTWSVDEPTFDFWEAVLLGKPIDEFRPLAARTLVFWVNVFNNWLKMRPGPGMKPPHTINGLELQDILKISPREQALKIMRVFDPQGSRLLDSEGRTTSVLSRIKVVPVEIMTVGVFLSPLIISKNKLKFMFGLFDEDDSGCLDEHQFLSYWKAWAIGMGKVFAVKPPSVDDFRHSVRAMYVRLSLEASKRLKQLALDSGASRAAILEAIRNKQSQQSKPETPKCKKNQVVSYNILEEMTIGDSSTAEPQFFMPNMAMLRFCPARATGSEEAFVENFENLTHSAPVPVPTELARVHAVDLPNRVEVVLVRDIYDDIAYGGSDDVERAVEASPLFKFVDYNFQRRLAITFQEAGLVFRQSAGLFGFLRKMYPKALPRHFRLFQQWIDEYDALAEHELQAIDAAQALGTYQSTSRKPIIPFRDLEIIKQEFEKLDTAGIGAIPFQVISDYLGTDCCEIASKYDLDADAHVGLAEFCRMMCPAEYRLPDMDSVGRRLFGTLLDMAAREGRHSFSKRKSAFETKGSDAKIVEASSFEAMLEAVPEDVWAQWQEVFDSLDRDGDDKVHLSDLLVSGALSEEVSRFVIKYLDPESPDEFTRKSFNAAMLKAHGYRKRVSQLDIR
eukprot:gb/GFBE01048515.1/.p1 GENE.gb/GFBE01048515.1/~~gb/GFBE01048515.1/.p1  ORF type:complete len:665 (+),score=152.73 gb/GFBE01048515.1/:1-1995(+)